MTAPEEHHEGAPEWMVSYADMITIMMAFFVILYALSGRADEQKTKPMVQALRAQFGKHAPLPGFARVPERDDRKVGLVVPRIQTVPPATQSGVGGLVHFDEDSAELSDAERARLNVVATELRGKLQRVELRGHTSRQPVKPGSGYRDHWDLAYARCRTVADYLSEQGIEPRRMRFSVSGSTEPRQAADEPTAGKENSRVEVVMVNQTVDPGPTGGLQHPAAAGKPQPK